jgi:peptidoglycan L-alanyl-D-glutamate endopeptidase CwlK
MYNFGKSSMEKLKTCHEDIQKVFNEVIRVSKIDIGISEGNRSKEMQKHYFETGKSKVKVSKHESIPSEAVDVFAYVNGKANYDIHNLAYIAGLVDAVSARLYMLKEIEHKIRWGGNWNGDGEIITDQAFDDLPHFEVV